MTLLWCLKTNKIIHQMNVSVSQATQKNLPSSKGLVMFYLIIGIFSEFMFYAVHTENPQIWLVS